MSTSPAETATGNGLPATPAPRPELAKLMLAVVIVLATALVLAVHVETILGRPRDETAPADTLMSKALRQRLAGALAGDSALIALFPRFAAAAALVWLAGASIGAVVARGSWRASLWRFGLRFLWLDVLALYEVLWGIGGWFGREAAAEWLAHVSALLVHFHTIAWGGWLASVVALVTSGDRGSWLRRGLAHPAVVWLAAAIYATVFATLSILQYRALMVPHGDTAMYEEHLWNALHGKGFRSQLDDGRLFFGEHLEVIHLLLVPIYVLAPSLPTLNVCLSIALGAGAIAVRGTTLRLTGSAAAANWLAVGYLLYYPLQYLNIEASLKTFRPENFGVPLMLFAIWCLESRRWRTMLVLVALALAAKEDYAIPAGMLGLYLAVRRDPGASGARARWLGIGQAVFAAVYLWFVLTIFIPHFRGGAQAHYMPAYYKELGNTPAEIVGNLVRHPGLLFGRLVTAGNLYFVLSLTLALGGLPLLGVGRLSVLVPGLVAILLSGLEATHSPLFHFHAPLVPVVFWAAAEGARRLQNADCRLQIDRAGEPEASAGRSSNLQSAISNLQFRPGSVACFATACALVSGFVAGKSPLALAFYDSGAGQRGFARTLYVPTDPLLQERVRRFEQLFATIPTDASVAATDYVRPRFTHHRECHQYGAGGLKPHVPPEAIDYIVVDLLGPFSDWHAGRRLREVQAEPDRWEVVWDDLFFYAVRAKRD